jgi:hypothetical protein
MKNNLILFFKAIKFSSGSFSFFWKFFYNWLKRNLSINITIFFLNILELSINNKNKILKKKEIIFFYFFFISQVSVKKKNQKNLFFIFLFFLLKNIILKKYFLFSKKYINIDQIISNLHNGFFFEIKFLKLFFSKYLSIFFTKKNKNFEKILNRLKNNRKIRSFVDNFSYKFFLINCDKVIFQKFICLKMVRCSLVGTFLQKFGKRIFSINIKSFRIFDKIYVEIYSIWLTKYLIKLKKKKAKKFNSENYRIFLNIDFLKTFFFSFPKKQYAQLNKFSKFFLTSSKKEKFKKLLKISFFINNNKSIIYRDKNFFKIILESNNKIKNFISIKKKLIKIIVLIHDFEITKMFVKKIEYFFYYNNKFPFRKKRYYQWKNIYSEILSDISVRKKKNNKNNSWVIFLSEKLFLFIIKLYSKFIDFIEEKKTYHSFLIEYNLFFFNSNNSIQKNLLFDCNYFFYSFIIFPYFWILFLFLWKLMKPFIFFPKKNLYSMNQNIKNKKKFNINKFGSFFHTLKKKKKIYNFQNLEILTFFHFFMSNYFSRLMKKKGNKIYFKLFFLIINFKKKNFLFNIQIFLVVFLFLLFFFKRFLNFFLFNILEIISNMSLISNDRSYFNIKRKSKIFSILGKSFFINKHFFLKTILSNLLCNFIPKILFLVFENFSALKYFLENKEKFEIKNFLKLTLLICYSFKKFLKLKFSLIFKSKKFIKKLFIMQNQNFFHKLIHKNKKKKIKSKKIFFTSFFFIKYLHLLWVKKKKKILSLKRLFKINE